MVASEERTRREEHASTHTHTHQRTLTHTHERARASERARERESEDMRRQVGRAHRIQPVATPMYVLQVKGDACCIRGRDDFWNIGADECGARNSSHRVKQRMVICYLGHGQVYVDPPGK